MKRREYKIFILFFIILGVLLPLESRADKFSIKASFGGSLGEKLNDSVNYRDVYFSLSSTDPNKSDRFGYNIYVELFYKINSYLSVSVGNGYSFKNVNGNSFHLSPIQGSFFEDDFILHPAMTAEVIPLCVSFVVTFPVGSAFNVNLLAGGGYYFGRFKAKSSIEILIPELNSRVFTPFNFQGNGNTAGFHAGGGIDIPLSMKIFLSVEAIYTSVKFKNVKSDSPVGGDTTFTFQQWIMDYEIVDLFDYRVSQIDLSGLTLRAGIMFQF